MRICMQWEHSCTNQEYLLPTRIPTPSPGYAPNKIRSWNRHSSGPKPIETPKKTLLILTESLDMSERRPCWNENHYPFYKLPVNTTIISFRCPSSFHEPVTAEHASSTWATKLCQRQNPRVGLPESKVCNVSYGNAWSTSLHFLNTLGHQALSWSGSSCWFPIIKGLLAFALLP